MHITRNESTRLVDHGEFLAIKTGTDRVNVLNSKGKFFNKVFTQRLTPATILPFGYNKAGDNAMRARIFHFSNVRQWFQPRKPRHPLIRLATGIVGLGILAMLVFFSLFVGAAMILAGVTWKLLGKSSKRASIDERIVEAEYRVVRKPVLPLSR